MVTGAVQSLGSGYVLTASVLDAGTGQPLVDVRETAVDDHDPIPAVIRLSKALRAKFGESLRSIRASEPLELVTTPSLPALRLYSEAVQAFAASDLERASTLLKQAVALDSSFAMAWRKLASVGVNLGDATGSIVASTKAYKYRDHLPPIERNLTEATYLEAVRYDHEGAIAAYRQVLALNPDDPTALNNAGLISNEIGRYADAEALLRHGVATDPFYTQYVNLGDALIGQSKRGCP